MCVDIYSFSIPASLGLIEKHFGMTRVQAAWFLGAGSLASGLAQPLFAWLSDLTNKRFFGGLGIVLAATWICSLGFAGNVFTVFVFYIFGMIGNGMFHPIAASTIGQLASHRRSLAVSLFFVAGMAGGAIGSVLGSRFIAEYGIYSLRWFIIPGVLVGLVFHWAISGIEHRGKDFKTVTASIGRASSRWISIGLLYIAASIRFSVNMSLVYLMVRLVEGRVATSAGLTDELEIARLAAPTVGQLNGFMIAGMAIGGFAAGSLIKAGKEKWPLVLGPFLFAPAIAILPFVETRFAGIFTMLAGIGFASMVPVTVAVGQRLLPHRTSFASGLLLGGAWAIALVGPRVVEYIQSQLGLSDTFFWVAVALAVSGLVLFPLSNKLLLDSANWSKSR